MSVVVFLSVLPSITWIHDAKEIERDMQVFPRHIFQTSILEAYEKKIFVLISMKYFVISLPIS